MRILGALIEVGAAALWFIILNCIAYAVAGWSPLHFFLWVFE